MCRRIALVLACSLMADIGEYTTSGATVNPSLISGLTDPIAIAISPAPEPPAIALAGLGALVVLVWRWSVWRR